MKLARFLIPKRAVDIEEDHSCIMQALASEKEKAEL